MYLSVVSFFLCPISSCKVARLMCLSALCVPQVCLKKSAHCSWRAKLGEEASCVRRPVCGCHWLIVCLHSWLLSALILFRAEYRPYGGRSFRNLRSPFGYTPSESRSPPHTGHCIPTRGT